MRHRSLAIVLLALLAAAGCDDDGTGVEPGPEALVGSWISAGPDIAPGFRHRDSLAITFGDDGSFESVEYAGQNPVSWSGPYEVGEGDGPIYAIVLLAQQATPRDTLARGIVRMDGDRMQLEVSYPWAGAYLPPTVDGGFGSTLHDGAVTGPYWVQVYRRME